MTQKRFIKLLIAQGFSPRWAKDLVSYMKELRMGIEKHEDLVMMVDPETMKFLPAKVYPYRETYQRILEGRDFFV